MKNYIALISIGVVNVLHALMHVVQFLQSVFLMNQSMNQHGFIDDLLHNPIFSVIWGLVGLLTLWIGIKDYKHHKDKNCSH
jgi:ABC-type long-subunit fatty acid transport system fused permease/ATPase subunit